MNWHKIKTLATTANASAMLLEFSVFNRLHFTVKFELDVFL
jgi:hypothetical protein